MSFILIKFTPEQLKLTRQLSTTDGFYEMFQQNLTMTKTVIRAYRMTEELHEDLFGRTKYSSYNSFRITIHKRK